MVTSKNQKCIVLNMLKLATAIFYKTTTFYVTLLLPYINALIGECILYDCGCDKSVQKYQVKSSQSEYNFQIQREKGTVCVSLRYHQALLGAHALYMRVYI